MVYHDIYNIREYKKLAENYATESLSVIVGTEVIEPVEMGLSKGELCQSLIDRIRQDLKTSGPNNSTRNFNHNGFTLETPIQETMNLEEMLQIFENSLYNTEIEKFTSTVWNFKNENIYISEGI